MSAVALAAVGSSGCGLSGLDIRADNRLKITSPEDRASVSVPFAVRWTMQDQRPEETSFAVLIDTAPPRPGQTIYELLPASERNPQACDQPCQDIALRTRGVYLTKATAIEVPVLPRPDNLPTDRARRHTVTVIVLGSAGERLTEVADSVVFDEEFK